MSYVKTLLNEMFAYSAITSLEILYDLENISYQSIFGRGPVDSYHQHCWYKSQLELAESYYKNDKRKTLAPENLEAFVKKVDAYVLENPDANLTEGMSKREKSAFRYIYGDYEKRMSMKKEPKYYLDTNNARWYVYIEDFNKRQIVKFNIFQNWPFREDCENLLRKNLSKEEFAEKLYREVMYRFWSKCEYEIIMTSWPYKENFDDVKVDVADQIFMNYQAFIDYIWTYLRPIARQLKIIPAPVPKLLHTDWRGLKDPEENKYDEGF